MTHILLTGSSRGIGAAIRQQLNNRPAQDGVSVIGHASKAYDEATIGADFSDPAAPKALWDEALARSGGTIDVLINNAGLFDAEPLDGSDADWLAGWQRTLDINLSSAARLSRLAVLHWQERGAHPNFKGGRIVHIASRAGHRGDSPAHWHYAAAKGGMLAMHKTIARAYAKDRICSYAITPGFTDTAPKSSGPGDYLESRGGAGLLADIPLGRVAHPEEIANIAVYLALDAPESLTGATIDANGASYVR